MKQSVLITGSEGGIGRSLVAAFAGAGWDVIGVDRKEAGAPSAERVFLNADIGAFASAPEKLDAFREEAIKLCGEAPLRALVNNAAVQHLGPLEQLSAEAIAESFDVNVIAPMLLAKAFLPQLRAGGVIINIGSVHARATKPRFSAYATSKAALHGLTRALAVDLGPETRVVTIAPAATATAMLKAGFEGNEKGYAALKDIHPLGRIAEPDEIARLALFAAGADAGFLTGTTLYADGGVLSRLHDPE